MSFYIKLIDFCICCTIYSLRYIDQDINTSKESMPLFIVVYLLNYDGPCFSPNLEIDSVPNFYGLVNSLLEDMVETNSHMEKIADGYPPYNVRFHLYNFHVK